MTLSRGLAPPLTLSRGAQPHPDFVARGWRFSCGGCCELHLPPTLFDYPPTHPLCLRRMFAFSKKFKTGGNPCKIFFERATHSTTATHTAHPHTIHQNPTQQSLLCTTSTFLVLFVLFPFPSAYSNTNFPHISISTQNLPESHFHSLYHISPLQLRPNTISSQQKLPSPIYKTAHPSVLDYPSRNLTPVLPKPSVLANQSTNHTPCHHSQHSRVGCESRFHIMSRRFDPHRLQIYFWPPCP